MVLEGDFAQRLRMVRLWYGLTQKELAELLGVTESCVAQYENSYREPKTLACRAIAEQLNVPFMWLCGWGETFAFEVEDK